METNKQKEWEGMLFYIGVIIIADYKQCPSLWQGFIKPKVSKKNVTGSASLVFLSEDRAATRIQTAFKAYKVHWLEFIHSVFIYNNQLHSFCYFFLTQARKMLQRLKGIARAKLLTEKQPVKKQAAVTLKYLHSWSNIQSQIKARRVGMVMEGRLIHKRLENQQKLEAKLHDIEVWNYLELSLTIFRQKNIIKEIQMQVEWNGGTETKDEILERIHQREEAMIKRERALAYAFSHQVYIKTFFLFLVCWLAMVKK